MRSFDPSQYITRLYVEKGCLDHPYCREIVARSNLPVTLVQDNGAPASEGAYPANLTRGKRDLFLCRNRGRFFKPCPATREYQCCGYHVLSIGMNCPMDCVYCILQAYLNNPWLSFFVNIEDMFGELDRAFAAEPDRLLRIGTGEFTDSLALDDLTRLSPRLVEYMAGQTNGFLELKTKSAVIENLKDLNHNNRTVVAWSLNSPVVAEREELRTASLDERLAAAQRCAEWGYSLAFHFDPVILHQGWREGYRSIIERLFQHVDPDAITWISLGALRYLPHLKSIAGDRFPGSRFFYEEFVEGLDGKARYFRTQRLEMYKWLVDLLCRYASPGTCIYFCMESDLIWREVFGYTPSERGGLATMLDDSLSRRRHLTRKRLVFFQNDIIM